MSHLRNIGLVRIAGSLPLQLFLLLFRSPIQLPFRNIHTCRERSARLLVALREDLLREVILETSSWALCFMMFCSLLAKLFPRLS